MAHMILEQERLRVVIDGDSGAIREIMHVPAQLSLIARQDVAARHPFMVIFADGRILRTWTTCEVGRDGADAATIRWTLEGKLRLTAQLRLDPAGELRCVAALSNPSRLPVAALAYPYIAGIGRLTEQPGKNELVHPYATGFLVRDPVTSLPLASTETEGQQPILLGLYPEGFSGSTMQFMAYSAVDRGGFYIGTEDSAGLEKWLNFYRHLDGDLRMAVWHGPADYVDRCDVDPGYETVISALDGGSWYDAADRYKNWALAQAWVAQGPLWARDDRPRWLYEQVGLCTFGINARHDRSAWLAAIDRLAGTPALHLLGVNWTNTPANYLGAVAGGVDDWFPAHFHPENVATIRANGDYLVPFEFDLLFPIGAGGTDAEAGRQAQQVFPTPRLSRDTYDFPFLCPVSPFTRRRHVTHDRELVAEAGVDGVYYDISLNNVRHICLASGHGHAVGDTAALTRAYKTLLAATATAMREAADGRTQPQGTELINEQMIPYLQFYQARAEASPSAPFEAGIFRDLLLAGVAEKIPLFAYVYHEYGPVRLDGWAKLSREQGDFVYFVLSRVFLEGGLIELNYEFSALEDLDGRSDNSAEHYYPFPERHYRIDPDLAAFVRRLAQARVGRANRYLAYSAMLRPAPMTIDGGSTLLLHSFQYNCPPDWPEYEDRRAITVPTVLQTAWRYREEGVAWLLINLALDARRVQFEIEVPRIGGPQCVWRLTQHQEGEASISIGLLAGGRSLVLTLPPRTPVAIEALPQSGAVGQ